MQIDNGEGQRFSGLAGTGHCADAVTSTVVSGRPTWLILDVEGTLVPTAYVHTTLFGHARTGLRGWLDRHADTPVGRDAVAAVRRCAGLPTTADLDDVLAVLLAWTDEDRKEPALKTIQGFVWQDGYARGELRTPLFPDVAPALRRWRAAGHRLGVFSSGSVLAQRTVFSHTDAGDLRDLFDQHFDPAGVGPKRTPEAYHGIRAALAGSAPPTDDQATAPPVFLSDVPAELDAARAAGWQTVGVARSGEPNADADFGTHRVLRRLDDLAGVTR